MLDIVIRGGSVIDGSGGPAVRADIGIENGRIVRIGTINEAARDTIDATGLTVAPGFIDVHTHYDAQAFWDGTLSPSCYHGVTTVIAGNCGFSIAPLNGNSDDADYLMRMLARVEGMPLQSLQTGVPWNWRSFGEFLGRLEGKLAINAGFMVGHSAIRRHVMGARAVGHAATNDDLEAMRNLLRESIAAGGLGWSSTIAPTHNDADGKPVPSRHATDEELDMFARVLSEFPGTTLEFLPGVGPFTEREKERMARLSRLANRPLNWNLLLANSAAPDAHGLMLGASDYAAERGGRVVALTLPQPQYLRVNLVTGFVVDALPNWAEIIGKPLPERIKALADPEVREMLDAGAKTSPYQLFQILAQWEKWTVDEVFSSANRMWQGKTIAAVAAATGKEPLDALLDISVSEGLRTSFIPPPVGSDEESWRIRGELLNDPRTIIGASDAGAHLDMLDTFAFSTQLLEHCVRERKLIGLVEAVHQITGVPARLMGIKNRGLLKEGYIADIVIFDHDRIASGPTHMRFDLPGGAGRLYADAIGVARVIVNGHEIVRDGTFSGAFAGTVLRSGRDTYTVTVA